MITVNASRREPICLRHQGENDAMRVAFPLSAFEADWPGGTPLLLVQRPRSSRDAEAYPVALSVDGHTAYWTVSASDVEYSGYGKAQLQWRVENVLVKSCIYDTVCVPSLHAGAEPPDEPSKRWFDAIQAQIGNLADLTTEEKKNLVAAINEAARSGGGGSGGADGYSPVAKVEETADGAKITITDKTGTTEATVKNGKDGANGAPGTDGKDGAPGKDGADGAPGKDGVTPTIGANGNWYLGDEDTGKPSRGATGPQGTPGKTPDIKIGTVTTLPAGSEATASMGGTAAQPTLNLGIPKGADGDDANVTKNAVVGALGFTPIGADDVPVKSVNGQTGEAKTNWYFNVTGSVASPATTQTVAQIVAAQTAGFAPICKAVFSDFKGLPATLPALLISDMLCVFGGIGSTGGDTFYLTVMIEGRGNLTAKTDAVAAKSDIPTIPTALKNPHSLNIKIGNTTTSYDGSAVKTVEIPEGGGTDESLGITGAAAGEFPKVSAVNENGAPTSWETVESEEVTLGGDVPAPTDAQVSLAVDTWLTEHPEATTTVQDGSVSIKKLGYGKHVYGSKPYFCNSVGSGAVSYGSIGVVVPCKAGDTIYCNFNMSPNGAYKKPQLLAALPENQYGAIAPIGTIEKDDTTKAYTVPASATTAKAMYLPQNFVGIPAANNGSVEDALAWINKTMGTDGSKCAQNVPFEDYDAWYQTAQAELFDIDESCNKLMYASLYQAVSKLVGAKVAVLGDSLTEQSACSFITSAYNDRWMENVLRDTALTGDDGKTYKGSGWFALIARKYKIKWWCAGHGAQWWYSTTERPNGATAMVRKLIDGTDEFDYIVLEYGTNDILSGYTHIGTVADEASETATTSCGAIKWCIEQLQMRFPEASIVVILPNIRSGANGESPAMQQTYLDTVVPILKKYGVRRVNMAEDSGIVKSMMSTDGVHLRWPVVSNNVTHYTNDTPAVRKFSKCLEAELLKA